MFWNLAEEFASSCMGKREGFNNNNNNNVNNNGNNNGNKKNNLNGKGGSVLVVMLLIWVLVLFVLAPYLWNNVLCRLVPVMRKSQWYDMFLLAVLLAILLPARM